MASADKRCLYEVLGLLITCSADDIRSAYKRLALQRHPDKLVKSGISPAEANASFQELVSAYEVLSDPKERSWYDSHRSQILFSNPAPTTTQIPDLFPFFSNSAYYGFSDTGKGFYKVYSGVFDKVYANEINFSRMMGLGSVKEAPIMGNLESPYSQAKAFFDYWVGFVTVMDFCWSDHCDPYAEPSRKSRRVMEEENRKLRKKARREYNETVRGLAEFVKKRDKRVIEMLKKKEAETAKRRDEEKNRLKEKEKEKSERARMYQEPEWSRIDEEELQRCIDEDDDEKGKKKGEVHELYCILCGKKFRSEKQWKNHEQSKKHKEKEIKLRHSFVGKGEIPEKESEDFCGKSMGSVGIEPDASSVNKLSEQLREMVGIEENGDAGVSSGEDEQHCFSSSDGTFVSLDDCESDDENSVLKSMVSANRTGSPASSAMKDDTTVHHDDDDGDFFECDTTENKRKNTREKDNGREKIIEVESSVAGNTFVHSRCGENHSMDGSHMVNSASHSFTQNDAQDKNEQLCTSEFKNQGELLNKKGAATRRQTKNSKKLAKQKLETTSSSSSKRGGRCSRNTCETCGHDFESRNQLHKHLGDTGHASLKYHRL